MIILEVKERQCMEKQARRTGSQASCCLERLLKDKSSPTALSDFSSVIYLLIPSQP